MGPRTCAASGSPAVDNDGFVPRIPLPFLDLTNEIDETGARRRHRLLGPVRVLELLHVERGAVMSVNQLELPQNIVSEVCAFAGETYGKLTPMKET